MPKRVQWSLLATILAILVGANVAGASSPTGEGQEPDGPQGGFATVACEPGEMVVDEILEVGIDEPGGPNTPEAALANYVRRDAQALTGKDFERKQAQAGEMQLTLDSRGRTIANALVEQIGDSWYVTQFTACETSISEEKGGAE